MLPVVRFLGRCVSGQVPENVRQPFCLPLVLCIGICSASDTRFVSVIRGMRRMGNDVRSSCRVSGFLLSSQPVDDQKTLELLPTGRNSANQLRRLIADP